MKYPFLFLLSLNSCAYRYGTGYFMNDVPPQRPPTTNPQPVPSTEPTTEEDCAQTIEQLEITNKLDSKNNTITTTAVTKHEHSRKCP